jgi:hypothetical protein
MLAWLPACQPASQPANLPACLPACLPAFPLLLCMQHFCMMCWGCCVAQSMAFDDILNFSRACFAKGFV